MNSQFPNSSHLSIIRDRFNNSRFVNQNDVFLNSPPEGSEMLRKANLLLSNPTKTGTSQDETVQIWRGYPGSVIDPVTSGPPQYPIMIGEGAQSAAMYYAITGNQTYANAVKTNLLTQVRLPRQSGFIGALVSEWPTPPLSNRGTTRPSSFSGQNESLWLERLGQAYLLVKDVFSPSERSEFETWHTAFTKYFSSIINARVQRNNTNPALIDIPGYLNLDLSVRRGVYADGFPIDSNAKILYFTSTGSTGPRALAPGQVFGNIYSSTIAAAATNYAISGDLEQLRTVRAFYNAWLFFSVFPDGTLQENVRNDDYGHPGRGALWYGSILLQSLCQAELMLRTRGQTMLDITQRGGLHGTQCNTNQSPKTLRIALERYLNGFIGQDLRYDKMPAISDNAIQSPYVGKTPSLYGDNFVTWVVPIMGMAYAIYGDQRYLEASRLALPGMAPYPSSGHTSAGQAPRAFNGTGDQIQPGQFTLWYNCNVRY